MCIRTSGFSLVEVVLAIGIIAFAVLSVLALLPIGIRSNQISADETRAIGILTVLEADLRNTRPTATTQSSIYDLPLPYVIDANGSHAINPNIGNGGAAVTRGLTNNEEVLPPPLTSRPRYQVSVTYRNRSNNSVDARLIVNWPGIDSTDPRDLTDSGKVSGFVEVFTVFRMP
jgi:type II secretory pathway pseudopilin PulG